MKHLEKTGVFASMTFLILMHFSDKLAKLLSPTSATDTMEILGNTFAALSVTFLIVAMASPRKQKP